ncbi:hypothetical protein, partial [Salmonella enterica]
MYTWLCMAVIIPLSAIIFFRVADDTQQNMGILLVSFKHLTPPKKRGVA